MGQLAAVGQWHFDGDLRDATGRGSDAFSRKAQFAPGRHGSAARLNGEGLQVADCAELRLAPGLRIECWFRCDAAPPVGGQEIVAKPTEYMLRVNPQSERGGFGFFLYLDGWEPRVESPVPVQPNAWYHLVAGWDGKELMLSVNGEEFRRERAGTPARRNEPLRLGPLPGLIDELRIDNPGAAASGVAYWAFDGDLRDGSGHGHDFPTAGAAFASGRLGQALASGSPALELPDHPDLRLAAGIRIDCQVRFDQLPPEGQVLVIKDDEYQLRVNPAKEGGCFAFFVKLDGRWEPRVTARTKAETGVWYRVAASWTGLETLLDVNGERERTGRSGIPQPTANPLVVGPVQGLLDELRIENPRLPVLRVEELAFDRSLLRAGRSERLAALLRNHGNEARACSVQLALSEDVVCTDALIQNVGTLPSGGSATVQWTVRADASCTGVATLRLTGEGFPPVVSRRALPFLAATDPDSPVTAEWPPPRHGNATTYYVDGVAGNNANSGMAEDSAWRDFTNVNGRTLGPGERLLIKRGSVINQELQIAAEGAPDNWAEIGAYGDGPRPTIRRNWHIDDRCVLVISPDYLRIRSLILCHAGKGLIVHYRQGGRKGLVIEDCIAHHIEGMYRFNSHGIPEWRDCQGAPGDGLHSSAGFAMVGSQASDLVLRDCEMFHCSWGFRASGDAITVDRVFCHDNYAHNTSPHPALTSTRRSYLQNSVLDAPGYHAFAGTMGIMLVGIEGLVIRNCTFRNQPDSGSHDEGGVDFEARGYGCLIDRCTFENNAGAAIEMLGLKSPQAKNVEIANSRFIRNNTATKLGPSEIYIWGKSGDPAVCCSTGLIHGNGYVLNPGIEFFVNEAPKTTDWKLRDNRQFATREELDRAMPLNNPPVVQAGPDQHVADTTVQLAGTATDDGRPGPGPLRARWEVLEGPGRVTFADAGDPRTAAEFAAPGDYLLRLVADDGELWLSDRVWIHVLPAGGAVAQAWEFSRPLDKEGWTEANLGTRVMEWKDQQWPCVSQPVHHVGGGGYYIVAVEDSPNACLLSPDRLGLDLGENPQVAIRMQNHTPATAMRLAFLVAGSAEWRQGPSFAVVPADDGLREYVVDLAGVPGSTGKLDQLRLDLATGTPLTGTCRIDCIWVGRGLAR